MRKSLIASVLCFIMVVCPLFVFAAAAGTDGWTNLEGFVVDGNKVPAEVTMTDKGLQFMSSKGYYTADGNYSGVFLDTQVDPGNFSVEFTIDKVAGKAPETDTWIGLMLSNTKKYFDVKAPTASQGLVTLIRPWNDDTTHFQTFQMVDAFGANGEGIIKTKAEGATFKVEFKKNTDGTYAYYVNGTKLESIFDGFDDVFADGKAYFSMGCSTNNAQPIQFTITKVNGTPVAELNAVKAAPKTEVKGWTNLEGFVVDGNKVPAEVTMSDKGLQFMSSKGYYTADGNYSGVFLDTQVDPGNFSVEFTIDKVAGKAPETDTWIGLMLSNTKKYFDVKAPTASQGLVTLIRPWNDDTTHFQTFQMVDAFGANGEGIIKTKAEGATFKVEFKKNTDGTYAYYVNGTKLESIFDGFDDVFADGKAYFSMGCSTNNAQPIQFTITKVNGTPVAELNADKETENPKTGDASTIPFMVAAVASGLAGLALVRRKKAKQF